MSLLRSMTGGLRSLFRKEQVSHELDEELNGFLEMAAEEKMKQGMGRKEALRAVRLERGDLEATREVVRSAVGNLLWRRVGRICASLPARSARVQVSPPSPCLRLRWGLARTRRSLVW